MEKDTKHVLVGFGFGPIQAGLFAKEAREGGNFSDIVVAEVDAALIEAVRRNGNRYAVNVAHKHSLNAVQVDGITLLNPRVPDDRARLLEILSRATEIVTSLPSVAHFASQGEDSASGLIAEGLRSNSVAGTIVYTAENNNHAAEILSERMNAEPAFLKSHRPVQFLNTVIGKMSQVVTDPKLIAKGLMPVVPGFPRAFLVEEFNHIMISKVSLPGFSPGITVFEQKDDLLPFEEAKLFGHNAINTMLGFIAKRLGLELMSKLRNRSDVMKLARDAFISETGRALIAKYRQLGDPLFTQAGFEKFADDLLERMVNPYLSDTVDRAMRDPVRKLGYSDRMFGAMRVCLAQGVVPAKLAAGALAGLQVLLADAGKYNLPAELRFKPDAELNRDDIRAILAWLWREPYTEEDLGRISELLVMAGK